MGDQDVRAFEVIFEYDALKDYGVVHLDTPISAEAVWRLINGEC